MFYLEHPFSFCRVMLCGIRYLVINPNHFSEVLVLLAFHLIQLTPARRVALVVAVELPLPAQARTEAYQWRELLQYRRLL